MDIGTDVRSLFDKVCPDCGRCFQAGRTAVRCLGCGLSRKREQHRTSGYQRYHTDTSHREGVLSRNRGWRLRNLAYSRARVRAWQRKNRDRLRVYNRGWYRRHNAKKRQQDFETLVRAANAYALKHSVRLDPGKIRKLSDGRLLNYLENGQFDGLLCWGGPGKRAQKVGEEVRLV